MRGVIRFFLHNTVAANLLMVFIFIIGLFGLAEMKTTFFPERPSKNIMIQAIYPGASPEEMEEGIVNKIEDQLTGINGVKRSTSTSSENVASVNIEVDKGFDAEMVVQDVKNAVDQISSFPAQMEPPTIYKVDQLSEAYTFAISGDVDLSTLKMHAETIEDNLLAFDGISRVAIAGYPPQEIEITFRERDMQAFNISFDEAVAAVAGNNLLSTGGTIKTEKEELLIRAENKNYYAAELENIVLRSNRNGGIIRLDQIASIRDKWEDSPERSFINGQAAVVITANNTNEEDMFDVVSLTKAYLDDYKLQYPNLEFNEIRDGKKYLDGRIDFIKKNGLLGFLIVLLLLAMFLNIRLAFWVALAIPISFLGMFAFASILGVTINVISTFAMIVVIGILVDDGIVIAENIYQHYEKGEPAMEAAINGTMEVLPAVSAAILTTVIAFSTFFFIDGFLGDIFYQLSVVVIFTLIFSLIEGIFILPSHVAHSKALQDGMSNNVSRFFDSIMNFMKEKIYGPVLRFSMDFPIPAVAFCVALLLATFGAMNGGIIKGTFFPFVQQDDIRVTVELPAGSREDQVVAILDSIQNVTWRTNKALTEEYLVGEKSMIEKIQMNIGPESYQGNLRIFLLEGEQRGKASNYIVSNAIREDLGPIHEADKLVFGMGNMFGDPVSISLLSKDPVQLKAAVTDLKDKMGLISDLRDIEDSDKEGLKELKLELKPLAFNLGFTLSDIVRTVRQGFFGAEIQRLQRGSDEVKVWVRYEQDDRSSIADLADMRIRSADGQSIPLGQLADFKQERGTVSIFHIDGQREVRVTADVSKAKTSVSAINADIQEELLPDLLAKYPAVKVGMEGQARQTADVQASMQKTIPLILLMMLFVIILTFSSVSQALVVFAILPFGFIGVGFGHWFMDQPISLLSILGVIALIGIFVNDALVFISAFNVRIKDGIAFRAALYQTGLSRFRPITLTTLTTVAGLLPLMLEKSIQAQFLIPMAISVAFGLMIGTFILLVMLPALLTIASNVRVLSNQIWTGVKTEARMMEPAFPGRRHPWWVTIFTVLIFTAISGALLAAAIRVSGLIL